MLSTKKVHLCYLQTLCVTSSAKLLPSYKINSPNPFMGISATALSATLVQMLISWFSIYFIQSSVCNNLYCSNGISLQGLMKYYRIEETWIWNLRILWQNTSACVSQTTTEAILRFWRGGSTLCQWVFITSGQIQWKGCHPSSDRTTLCTEACTLNLNLSIVDICNTRTNGAIRHRRSFCGPLISLQYKEMM